MLPQQKCVFTVHWIVKDGEVGGRGACKNERRSGSDQPIEMRATDKRLGPRRHYDGIDISTENFAGLRETPQATRRVASRTRDADAGWGSRHHRPLRAGGSEGAGAGVTDRSAIGRQSSEVYSLPSAP